MSIWQTIDQKNKMSQYNHSWFDATFLLYSLSGDLSKGLGKKMYGKVRAGSSNRKALTLESVSSRGSAASLTSPSSDPRRETWGSFFKLRTLAAVESGKVGTMCLSMASFFITTVVSKCILYRWPHGKNPLQLLLLQKPKMFPFKNHFLIALWQS